MAKESLEAKLLKAKMQQEKRAAAKREANVKKAIETGDVSNLLKKGEELAFSDQLRDYQKQAVMETVRNFRTGRHTLNASAVGLGKTRMAGSFCNTISSFKKVLWITGKTLTDQTARELNSIGCSVVPLPSNQSAEFLLSFPLPKTTIYIIHYEMLKRDPALHTTKWDCVVIDEVSKLKGGASGRPTQIWKDTKKFLHEEQPKAFRYFLSGTPAENRPEEIWAYLHLFDPNRFDNFYQFKNAYCGWNPIEGKPTFSTEKLLELCRGNVIRMTVENMGLEGAPSLKDPTWFHATEIMIELDKQSSIGKAYRQMATELRADLGNDTLAPNMILEQMLRLRQLLSAGPKFTYTKQEYDINGNPIRKLPITLELKPSYPKIDAAEELISSLQSEGEAVVVFSCFNEPLHNLKASLDRTGFYTSALLTGDTPIEQRNQAVRDFQNGDLDVILINKMAGAKGLNLQKCDQWKGGSSNIIHLDRWWNPAIEEQANGRCVRMNSTHPTQAYYLHVVDSIDDYMKAMVDSKDEAVNQLDRGLLTETLNRFLKD